MKRSTVRGVVFDLDGTLVDSALDFDRMRAEMGLPEGLPILEAMAEASPAHQRKCWEILERHEYEGARRATLMPGAREFLAELDRRGLRRAIITRNARQIAVDLLARLELEFDPILGRECAPIKPDPTGLLQICENWNLLPHEVLMIGDFRFDIETGLNAGAHTALYTAHRPPDGLPGAEIAHHILRSFHEGAEMLERI